MYTTVQLIVRLDSQYSVSSGGGNTFCDIITSTSMEARRVKLWLMVLIISSGRGEECLPDRWTVSPISYQDKTVSVSWDTGDVTCSDMILISQATQQEESISHPIRVSKSQAIVKVMDNCKLLKIRLAALVPGRDEVKPYVYSANYLYYYQMMLSIFTEVTIYFFFFKLFTPRLLFTNNK